MKHLVALLVALLLACLPLSTFAQGVGGGGVSGLSYIYPITPLGCAYWVAPGLLGGNSFACGNGSGTNVCTITGSTSGQVCTSTGPTTAPTFQSGTTYPGLPSNTAVSSTDLIAGYPSGGPLGTYTANQVATFVATNSVAGAGTSITPSCAYEDNFGAMTASGGTFTVNAPTGCTAAEGQKLLLHLKFTNSQTYSWNAAYVGGTTALPTTSTGTGKGDWVAFRYDSINAKWDYVATATGF